MKKTETKPIKRIPVDNKTWLEVPADAAPSEIEKRICNFLKKLSEPIYQFNPKHPQNAHIRA